jgi:hypothetical protein
MGHYFHRFRRHKQFKCLKGDPIMKMKLLVLALLSLALAFPAAGKTYKSSYDMPCSELWPAVKDTLSNQDNYTVLESDDAKLTASYKVKHAVHANISGALLQRNNRVTLVTKGSGCEMQVVSNYSGWEHNDQGDFKTRVDESVVKLRTAKPSEPAKPAGPGY